MISSKAIFVIVAVSVIAGAAAFTSFQHFFPSVTVQPASGHAGVSTTCGTSSTAPLTALGTPIVGIGGGIAFTCGTFASPAAALAVTSPGPATVTIGGTLSPYVSLYLILHSSIQPASNDPCAVPSVAIQLPVSGSGQINLEVTGDFDYCAGYLALPSGTTSLPSFQVTWS